MPSPDLAAIADRARATAADPTVAARALPLVDLTSLSGTETDADIERLCERAIRHEVAAVCVYPAAVATARRCLANGTVRLAAVANFPHGSDDLLGAVDEAAAAVDAGAEEIDVVVPLAAVQAGDVGLVGDLVDLCRQTIGREITLKVILETGLLREPDVITAAARAAVMAGADFLKTSTGKTEIGATPEAAALLLSVCDDAGGRVGFKAAGGIRTVADAAIYLALADEILGRDWVSQRHFRLGASSLLDDLLRVLGRSDGKGATGGGY